LVSSAELARSLGVSEATWSREIDRNREARRSIFAAAGPRISGTCALARLYRQGAGGPSQSQLQPCGRSAQSARPIGIEIRHRIVNFAIDTFPTPPYFDAGDEVGGSVVMRVPSIRELSIGAPGAHGIVVARPSWFSAVFSIGDPMICRRLEFVRGEA
jgi:hypothetical protein